MILFRRIESKMMVCPRRCLTWLQEPLVVEDGEPVHKEKDRLSAEQGFDALDIEVQETLGVYR